MDDWNDVLDVAAISASRQRMDAQIAKACTAAGRPELAEEMIASSWTLEQVGLELLRRASAGPARPGATAGGFAAMGREAFQRMAVARPAAAAAPRGGSFAATPWPESRRAP